MPKQTARSVNLKLLHVLNMREDLESDARNILRNCGWDYTCNTPGSRWMMQKTLPDGRIVLTDTWSAIDMETQLEREHVRQRKSYEESIMTQPGCSAGAAESLAEVQAEIARLKTCETAWLAVYKALGSPVDGGNNLKECAVNKAAELKARLAAAEKSRDEVRAEVDTEREVRKSQERSTVHLAAYALDDSKFTLPMSGHDVSTRDEIRKLRKANAALAERLRVLEEALRNASKIAWKMQAEQFGGGTAIGNEIEEMARSALQPQEPKDV